MLNITRRRGERIVFGDDIFVSVLEVSGQTVRLGIDAPEDVPIFRAELNDLLARIGAEPDAPASHELERVW